MNAPAATVGFFFAAFRLDRRGLFRRDEKGDFIPVTVGSRALEVLEALVARAGDLVLRDEIMIAVWPGAVVEASNLPVQIAALRRILDDGRSGGSCIQTVPGRGYRFVLPVTQISADERVEQPKVSSDRADSPPRLSIVVLPFNNLGDDREQQYFADGITEDLTTDLSRLPDALVISRNTAFTYQGKPIDTRRIGRDLGVRYVVEGSVRRAGDRVRIGAQLIDAQSDTHLWAERFDGDAADLLSLQNDITGRIAAALNLELISAETGKPTVYSDAVYSDALDLILRGRAALSKPATRENYAEAIALFERALAPGPHVVAARIWLATALVARKLDNMADSPAADVERAHELAEFVLATSPRSPLAHFARGQILRAQGRLEEAIHEYEAVIGFNRNDVNAIFALGWCKFLTGSIEEAVPLVEQAIRLSPRDPSIATWYAWIGRVHLLYSRIDLAIEWLEKARSQNSRLAFIRGPLAAAYALRGDTERAAAELAEARRLSGDDRLLSISHFKNGRYFGVASVRALYERTYFVGLRKAGMPES